MACAVIQESSSIGEKGTEPERKRETIEREKGKDTTTDNKEEGKHERNYVELWRV